MKSETLLRAILPDVLIDNFDVINFEKTDVRFDTLIIKGCTQFFFKIHDFGSAPLISIAPFSFVFMVFTRGFMRMVRTVSEGWMSLMVS